MLALVGAAALIYSFFVSSDDAFAEQIRRYREEKDAYLRGAKESPFAGNAGAFTGLKYYPANETFRITAEWVPADTPEVKVLGTSDGKTQSYSTYGWARFDLQNRKNELVILEVISPGPGKGTLFLAFGDETSGADTYGGGRYLDVARVPAGSRTIELDFNKAYNPYCAYNSEFSCPLPPRENLLSIAITAGEKSYH